MAGASNRVLVTGSRGFTGVHLRAELEGAGYTVVGLTDTGPASAGELVVDLRDARAVRQAVHSVAPAFVVHLAAISFVAHDSTEEMYAVNVMGTVNLLDALSTLRVLPVRTVLASSSNVYGNTDSERVAEGCALSPVSHYAASKLALEAVAQGFRQRLQIVVTRPFNYTGPGQDAKFFVPKVVKHFYDLSPSIELGNLDVERDFLDVRVVANVYRRLLECELPDARVVNICSGRGIRLRTIIDTLRAITSHSINVIVQPNLIRGNEILKLVGDNGTLRGLIGELPELPFETTLRDMLLSEGSGDKIAMALPR